MMKHTPLAGAMLALLLMMAAPQATDAQVWSSGSSSSDWICSGTSFNPCVEFLLYDDLSSTHQYSFVVWYRSSLGDPEGYMTAAGLYDYDNDGSPFEFDIENMLLVSPSGTDWSIGNDADCKKLSGDGDDAGTGGVFFEGCVADGGNGSDGALGVGEFIRFDFDLLSGPAITTDHFASNGGELGARVMIQGVGEPDCSYKLDSPKGFVSGCGGDIVPEPMTVILLATGLVGIGAVGYRTRRKEEEEV